MRGGNRKGKGEKIGELTSLTSGPLTSPLTCRLLLRRRALHLPRFRLQLDEQSKKLQSSSLLQFWSRMSLILGSKNAMSTSMATT